MRYISMSRGGEFMRTNYRGCASPIDRPFPNPSLQVLARDVLCRDKSSFDEPQSLIENPRINWRC